VPYRSTGPYCHAAQRYPTFASKLTWQAFVNGAGYGDCGSLEHNLCSELLVGLVAPLPALIAFLTFGVIETPDSGGYIGYAEQLRSGTLLSGAALLKEGPAPISLFRTPGYPALIVATQSLFGTAWKATLVLVQIIAHAALAVTLYRTAVLLRLSRSLAILVALLPSVGLGLVMQISLLTDAICAALLGFAALWLVQATLRPSRVAPVAIGIALARCCCGKQRCS